jgi:hypothetical protein
LSTARLTRFPGGVLAHAQLRAHLAQRLPVVEPQQDRRAVGLGERRDGLFEMRRELVAHERVIVGRRTGEVHGNGHLFTVMTAAFGAQGAEADKAGRAKQPAGEDRAGSQVAGFAGQQDKNRLGHVLRQLRVADLAPGHRVHPVEPAAHQLGKRRF